MVTPYPLISTRELSDPSAGFATDGAVFFNKYILKLQPRTRGSVEFVVEPDTTNVAKTKFRICKLGVLFVGANIPCLRMPGPEKGPQDNVVFQYGTDPQVEDKSCGGTSKITFKVSVLIIQVFLAAYNMDPVP